MQEPVGGGPEEALLQFLYQAPIGLVQSTVDGSVTLMNPMAARLLMRLAPNGDLGNLFDVLRPVAADLQPRVDKAGAAGGMLFDNLRLTLGASQSAHGLPSVL